MKKTVLFIVALFTLITSCQQKKPNQDESLILWQCLRTQMVDNQNEYNLIGIKENGNRVITMYRPLLDALHKMIVDNIDTTFGAAEKDTIELRKNFRNLEKKYHRAILDMYRLREGPFMTDDSIEINKIRFPLLYNERYTLKCNYFLTCLNALQEHKKFLKIFEYSFSNGCMYFYILERAGFFVNVLENKDRTSIKMHYNFPSRYGIYTLEKFISLENSDGERIKINPKILENDTVLLETGKLRTGKYMARVRYHLIRETGEESSYVVPFPFSTW